MARRAGEERQMESMQAASPVDSLPSTTGTICYAQKTDRRVVQDLVDRQNTYKPLEPHDVVIRDARPICGQLSLDEQGFILVDHKSSVSHLRDQAAMEEPYNKEMIALISDLSGADLVLPYLRLF